MNLFDSIFGTKYLIDAACFSDKGKVRGINEDNFSSELGPCFEMTSFHIQMAKGKEMLLLHRLRCELYEFLVVLMETHCTNKEIPVRVNQIINRLHQMICIAFGGDGCQRK